MSQRYKLTDADGWTRRGLPGATHWAVGTTVAPTGLYKGEPCGPGVLHAYQSVVHARVYNAWHGAYDPARCFLLEGDAWQTDGRKDWTTQPVRVVAEVTDAYLSITDDDLRGMAIVYAEAALAMTGRVIPAWQAWAAGWCAGERDQKKRAAALASNIQVVSDAVAADAKRAAWAAFDVGAALPLEHAFAQQRTKRGLRV